jgi:hypothetical protein
MTDKLPSADDATRRDGSRLSGGLGPLPEQDAWALEMYGKCLSFATNDAKARGESLGAKTRLYTEETVLRLLAAERERIERSVADLHMTQATNNQNCPRAWHDGIDAALEVIRRA